MQIRENVSLAKYSTMRLGGRARFFTIISNEEELLDAAQWAKDKKLPILPLGEGSNTIFTDTGFSGLVIQNQIKYIKITASDTIEAGGGTNWDEVVKNSVNAGLSGIETLSAIPGTAGAAPVQNIGAYGQEIKDSLISLELLDTKAMKFITFANKDCKFGYRDSIFKHTSKGRYIICSIKLRLSRSTLRPPFYKSLQKYLDENNITNYSAPNIRKAVIAIRAVRLPRPFKIPNSGSFFKNPIVSEDMAGKLLTKYPELVAFYYGGETKLSAGWLIEKCGFMGKTIENMYVYDKNALVLANPNNADYTSLEKAKTIIASAVEAKFGIVLEQEPETITG